MRTSLLIAAGGAVLALSAAAPAYAQRVDDTYQEAVPPPEPYETTNNKAIDRRLDRTEKALRELRTIVLRAQAQGTPVEVKPVGPDPVLTDLQQRFNDLDASVRDMTGQMESLRYELDQARKQGADALTEVRALSARLQQQEEAAAAAAPAAEPAVGAEEAAATGGTEAQAYQQARGLIDAGDYAGGVNAMQVFVQRYPNSTRVPTAHYWMGRAYAARNDSGPAAAAFAQSLRGWPQASWAADSVVQLADSLVAVRRTGDACKALGEFDSRYAAKASANVKAQAARTRTAANCR